MPFLGALAYGEEHRAKPFQRVIVLLLGPLPGLILGAAGIAVNAHLHADWLRELTLFLLTLNLFNLLPIMPLDGGKQRGRVYTLHKSGKCRRDPIDVAVKITQLSTKEITHGLH